MTRAGLAQLVERQTFNLNVKRSRLLIGGFKSDPFFLFGLHPTRRSGAQQVGSFLNLLTKFGFFLVFSIAMISEFDFTIQQAVRFYANARICYAWTGAEHTVMHLREDPCEKVSVVKFDF